MGETMTTQEINAATLLRLWQVGEQIAPHTGSTIHDLIDTVEKRVKPSLRLELQQDRSLELQRCPYEEFFGVESSRQSEQCHYLATVTSIKTMGTSCVKHLGMVEG